MKSKNLDIDFDRRPFIIIWEITQACDLSCKHCRAKAEPKRNPKELTTKQGKKLLGQPPRSQAPGLDLSVSSGSNPSWARGSHSFTY